MPAFAIVTRAVFQAGMSWAFIDARWERYVAEFDFRYSDRVRLGVDDAQRTMTALRGIYKRPATV